MPLDHTRFFTAVRSQFGRLSQPQVDGFNAILYVHADCEEQETARAHAALINVNEVLSRAHRGEYETHA